MNKKKRMLTLVLLLVVLALFAVVVLLLVKNKKPDTEETVIEETEKSEKVLSIDPDEVTFLSFKTEGYDSYSLVKENGNWILNEDKECPVSIDRIDSMVRAISKIKAIKEIESTDENGMGFTDPYMDIVLKTGNTETEVQFGKKNATGDAFYTRIVGENKVYLVSDTIRFSFERDKFDLVDVVKFPTFSELYVRRFDVISEGKEQVFTYYVKDDGYPAFQTLSGVPTSTNMMDSFLYKMEDMKFKKCVDYNVSKENLENKYGFKDPNAAFFLDYEDEQGQVGYFGLIVGDISGTETDTNGHKITYRYAMLQDVNIVYTLDESKYTEMMGYIFQE